MEKVAVLTGAGGGIGSATARELSQRGFAVVLVGRNEEKLARVQREIGESFVVVADVSKETSASTIIEKTLARFGRVDVLINNAGFAPVASMLNTSPQLWHEVIDTNLSAAFYLSRAVWPTFEQQGGGVIVNISSMSAIDPFAGFIAYGAAKAGLNNLGISLANEGASIGIRVFTIAPGAVETPMLRSIVSKDQLPTEQTHSPEAIARVIANCADGKTNFKSGSVIWLEKGD